MKRDLCPAVGHFNRLLIGPFVFDSFPVVGFILAYGNLVTILIYGYILYTFLYIYINVYNICWSS